jgi:uncharacterized repeat protein (TIGR01451 family)
LILTGSPAVALTTATAFVVTQPASPTIGSGSATTFTVAFEPAAAGNSTDTVSISSNDPDEAPHTFAISGTGIASDLSVVKTVVPTIAAPGGTITYTLTFSNAGSATATGVVITDAIPISVTHTSVISSGNASSPMLAITQRVNTRYVWDVTDMAQDEGGVITVTGVLSVPLTAGPFTNTATIATTSIDSNSDNNTSSVGVAVVTARYIYLPLAMRNASTP